MDLKFNKFDYNNSLEDYIELFKDAFPEVTDNSKDGYFWQMQGFPGDNCHSFEYSAKLDNSLVGFYAAIPYKYVISGKICTIGMVCGVMTSSKHRGKGIFTKLGSYSLQDLKDNVSFTTGYPIRKEVIPGHLKVGWKIAFELPLYMKFLKVDSLFKNKASIISFMVPLSNILLKIYYSILGINSSKNAYNIYTTDNILEISNLAKFENNWLNQIKISLVKDPQFLQWRYGRPGSSYKFIVVENKGEVCGFCSYRKIIKEGVPAYGILDLRASLNDRNVIKQIIHQLELEAKRDCVEVLMMMMSRIYAKKLGLFNCGFLKSPYSFKLIINNLKKDFTDEFLHDQNNWHLMWVDSDDL